MTTLVIHPEDQSTEFLKPIYAGIKNALVLTGGKSKDQVAEQIIKHDRIIMLGHGSPAGLFAVNKFETNNGLIIDHTMADILNDKANNIYIWCYANQFVNAFNLKGFYTGMFISELVEAYYCDVPANEESIKISNNLFANLVSQYNLLPPADLLEAIKMNYIIWGSEVVAYNASRLNAG